MNKKYRTDNLKPNIPTHISIKILNFNAFIALDCAQFNNYEI